MLNLRTCPLKVIRRQKTYPDQKTHSLEPALVSLLALNKLLLAREGFNLNRASASASVSSNESYEPPMVTREPGKLTNCLET
jgi:hypothetical protein